MSLAVKNTHQRNISAHPEDAVLLLATLGTPDDQLWPRGTWPAMKFPNPGEVGGHGPIRYRVLWRSQDEVRFEFAQSRIWSGVHYLRLRPGVSGLVIEHVIEARLTWLGCPLWYLAIRPLHDALIEDALDKAQRTLTGRLDSPARWSAWVKVLRWLAAKLL